MSGRVVLVTGVSRRVGIGAAVAARMLDDGASVVTTGFTPHDEEMPWETDPDGAATRLAAHAGAERWHRHPAEDFEDPDAADRVVAATIERAVGATLEARIPGYAHRGDRRFSAILRGRPRPDRVILPHWTR